MVGAAVGVVSAGLGAIGAMKASDAAASGAAAAARVQWKMYNQSRKDLTPWRLTGRSALYKLANLYGVSHPIGNGFGGNGGAGGEMGDGEGGDGQGKLQMTQGYGGFRATPGYRFRVNEGLKAIERRAAAGGARFSGATLKGMERFADNTASSEFENYANRLAAMAGIGQTSSAQTGAFGMQAANNIGNAYQNAGAARASGYENSYGAISGGLGNIAAAYLYNKGYGNTGSGSSSKANWTAGSEWT